MLWGRLTQKKKKRVFIIDWVNSHGGISHSLPLPQVSSAKAKPENEDCDLEKHNGQLWCQNLSLVAFSLRNSKHLGTQLFSLWVNAQKVEQLRCGWAVPPSIPLHRQHFVVMENDKKINREAWWQTGLICAGVENKGATIIVCSLCSFHYSLQPI